MDPNIITNETTSTSIPKSMSVIPPESPSSKSNTEDDRTSNIPKNLSEKGSNVNMGENTSMFVQVSSSTLPPPSSPQPSLNIPPTPGPIHSPTFDNIMHKPISKLLSSQGRTY